MGMTYTIKDANGNMLFAVEGASPVNSDRSIESMSDEISNESSKILNSLEKFSLISDTRAMESFGYYSLESESGKAKKENIFKRIGNAIVNFFKKIIAFFRKIIDKIVAKFHNMRAKHAATKMLKKLMGSNWKDLTKDQKNGMIKGETSRLVKAIKSKNMPSFILAKKFSTKLEAIQKKISNAIENGREIKDKSFENWAKIAKKEVDTIKSKKPYVSENERFKYVVDFYKEVAASGTDKVKATITKKLNEATRTKNAAERAMKKTSEDSVDYTAISSLYQINVAVWEFYTQEESVTTSLLSASMIGDTVAAEKGGKTIASEYY